MLSKKVLQKMLKYYIELKMSELEERVYLYIKNDTDHNLKYKICSICAMVMLMPWEMQEMKILL